MDASYVGGIVLALRELRPNESLRRRILWVRVFCLQDGVGALLGQKRTEQKNLRPVTAGTKGLAPGANHDVAEVGKLPAFAALSKVGFP